MKFYQPALGATFAIATVLSTQSSLLASSKLDVIRQPLQPTPSEWTTPHSVGISATSKGQNFFNAPPRLLRSAALQPGGNVPSVYEFTLTVPADAGQALQAVSIIPEPNFEPIRFDTQRSQAFTGVRYAKGHELALTSLGGEHPTNSSEVMVVFDQPVQPGQTVTIAVQANANPNFGGVYLFGVTAYPTGENSLGQFLGYGRIHFHGNSI